MFTLPANATDDELRNAVIQWFTLAASESAQVANEFLDTRDSSDAMTVSDFISRVADRTSGGRPTIPEPMPCDVAPQQLPIDGPVDIVTRWIAGPETT